MTFHGLQLVVVVLTWFQMKHEDVLTGDAVLVRRRHQVRHEVGAAGDLRPHHDHVKARGHRHRTC